VVIASLMVLWLDFLLTALMFNRSWTDRWLGVFLKSARAPAKIWYFWLYSA